MLVQTPTIDKRLLFLHRLWKGLQSSLGFLAALAELYLASRIYLTCFTCYFFWKYSDLGFKLLTRYMLVSISDAVKQFKRILPALVRHNLYVSLSQRSQILHIFKSLPTVQYTNVYITNTLGLRHPGFLTSMSLVTI